MAARSLLLPGTLAALLLGAAPGALGDEALPAGDGLGLPLAAPPPAWISPQIVAEAVAAGERGLLYDAVAGTTVPIAGQAHLLRPGGLMVSPRVCTLGFVHAGDAGDLLLSTAGHCVYKGARVVVLAAPMLLAAVATVVSVSDAGVGKDWALARIDKAFWPLVDPGVALVGGPDGGAYEKGASPFAPVPAKHVGQGMGGAPRGGLVVGATSSAFYLAGAASWGDSGAPVLVAASLDHPLGQAVGIVTHLVVDDVGKPVGVAGTLASRFEEPIVDGDLSPLA